MTKFFPILLLGMAAFAVFAWLRRRRNVKESASIATPVIAPKVTVQEDVLKPTAEECCSKL